MGSLDIYIKIFVQKLWNILWPLFENKEETKKKIEKVEQEKIKYSLTSVPDGYSLKLQGKRMCDGEAMESGGPLSVLDEFDPQKPSKQIGDEQFMLMLDRGRRRCNTAEGCKFVSVWKDGSYSLYDTVNCAGEKDGLTNSATLENLHQFSGGRVNTEGEIVLPPAPPPPPPPPPPLPSVTTREECSDYIENTLEPYDSGKTYPGLALSNKQNYCTTMLNRPGIVQGCQKRICGYTTGTRAGTKLDGLQPPWQAVESNGMTYYWNPDTNETKWEKPEHVASGDDFFEMRNFCAETCLNLVGNELPKSQSTSGSMLDALGEVLQVPDKLSGNPWMPPNNILNELPTLTEDDCLNANALPNWRPTKGYWFNLVEGKEESCAEDPDNPGRGLLRQKKFMGLTDDRKACRVEFRKTNTPCDRGCKVRFLKTEARAAGQHNRYKTSITSWEQVTNETDMLDLIDPETREPWEVGRPKGVKWGIDERPGIGVVNLETRKSGPEAPHGYKIMAEYVDIDAPALGNKTCEFKESGWYRTAKIPIEESEHRNIEKLKREWNFGSRMQVRLVNENDSEQVLVIDDPESGSLQKVYSKTLTYPPKPRNWKWDGPVKLG